MKRGIIFVMVYLCLFLLSGCGSDQAMVAFHDEMDGFYTSLSALVNDLESIDADSDTAVDEMLSDLDEMNVLFEQLAAIEVPAKMEEHFGNVAELADQASEYMAGADQLYHEAYAEGGYDESIAQAAWENYNRAMKRVNYIAILLQGRIPEDDNITVITEENEPDWNGGETAAPQPETASE